MASVTKHAARKSKQQYNKIDTISTKQRAHSKMMWKNLKKKTNFQSDPIENVKTLSRNKFI